MYLNKVHRVGIEQYANSFQWLFETLFQPMLKQDKVLDQTLVDCLKRPPYNLGFGCFLYLQREANDYFENPEQILKELGDFRQ